MTQAWFRDFPGLENLNNYKRHDFPASKHTPNKWCEWELTALVAADLEPPPLVSATGEETEVGVEYGCVPLVLPALVSTDLGSTARMHTEADCGKF